MARLVYSSGGSGDDSRGESRRRGSKRGAEPALAALPPGEQRLRISRQRAGRRGKTVTVVEPVRLGKEQATEMLRDLKKRCGSGGALKAGSGEPAHWVLELQGDRVDAVLEWLEQRGFPAKRSGG